MNAWNLLPLCVFLLNASFASGFEFRHHFVDDALPGSAWGQTALVDLDRDGDLDFITGQRGGDIRWYAFDPEGKTWSMHVIGKDSPSDVGGCVLDVNRDGRLDMVAGGAWYEQPEDAPGRVWPRHVFDADLASVHDILAADLDGDGREEVVTMSDKNDLRFYSIPKEAPSDSWPHQRIGEPVHAGLASGDL